MIKLRWGALPYGFFAFALLAKLESHGGRAVNQKWRRGEKKGV